MKINFDKAEPMTPEREIQILRDIVTKFAHSVGFAPSVPDVGRDAAYWRALHEAVLGYSHQRNATINALREALRSVGNDYYTTPGAWPDHIRALAYPGK